MRAAPVIALVVLAPSAGWAQERAASAPENAPVERTWLYLDEPRVPAALQVTALARTTVAGGGASFTRPFAANTASPGVSTEAGAEMGIAPRVSLVASGVVGDAGGVPAVGALAGARLAIAPSAWTDTHAVVSAGWLRDLTGSGGAWARVTASHDFGRVRVASMVHGEHVFAAKKDGVDLMLTAGVNVRVAGGVRLGAEYVAQDIEAAVDPEEAEGGVRHFASAVASVALADERLTIGLGPAVGLSPSAPRVLGRAAIGWSF